MATGMQQLRENLRFATCAAVQSTVPATTSRIRGAMEIDKAFNEMAIANCMQASGTGHNWFGNRAGAQEQFDALRKAALDPDFKGNNSFSLAQVEQLRSQLRNPQYNEQQAKALVTNMVNHATMVNNPVGQPIPEADRKALEGIINGAPQATPSPTPAGTPRTPPRGTAPAN